MESKVNKSKIVVLVIIASMLVASCSKPALDMSIDVSSENMIAFIEEVASVDNSRIAGFDGERATSKLIEAHFENLSLETEVQSFPIKAYALLDYSVTLISDEDRVLENVNPLSYSIGTDDEGVTAEVVSVGLGAETDYNDLDVSGKIVLIQRGGEYFFVKTDRAYSHGAVGVVFYDPNGQNISATLTKLSNIPAVSIQTSDANLIETELQSGVDVKMTLMIDATCEDGESQNVVGIYRSDDNPDQKRVIIGAHYDGVNTPAANDNASGTSVLLELARVVKSRELKLPFDLYFVAFGAEEIGLVGSAYYTQEMTPEERRNTLYMINFDMVGVGDSIDVSTTGDPRAIKFLDQAAEVLKEMGKEASKSEFSNSDHASFSRVGIKSILVQAMPDHNYHTDEDTIDKIQPEMLKTICTFALNLINEEQP